MTKIKNIEGNGDKHYATISPWEYKSENIYMSVSRNDEYQNINVSRADLLEALGAVDKPVPLAAWEVELLRAAEVDKNASKDHTAYTGDQYKVNVSAAGSSFWEVAATFRTLEAARGAAKVAKVFSEYEVQIWDMFDNKEVAL